METNYFLPYVSLHALYVFIYLLLYYVPMHKHVKVYL